ncbi:MAG: phosphoribosylanthranilate isomerase [Myxococcota bacterium]
MLTQIYGITTAEDAALVTALGPDHVGVVLDEGIETWDSVDEMALREIRPELRTVAVVALSLSTERERILATVDQVRPAWLHLARAADGLTPEAVGRLGIDVAPVQMMITIPVRDAGAIALARRFAGCADALLLDTAHPETGTVGATGLVHDWSLSRSVVEAVDVPVILAGGLGPDNVVAAIQQVRPAGVDSETRTSRDDDRRRKDPERVRLFLQRAQLAEAASLVSSRDPPLFVPR